MHIRTVLLILAVLAFAACDDDPIIGPTDDDTGGGSYGVIHFNTSPVEPGAGAAKSDSLTKENPKRF